MGIWPKWPIDIPTLALSRVELSVLHSSLLILMTFKFNKVMFWMHMWLYSLPKRSGPPLETNWKLVLVGKPSSFVPYMVWRVLDRLLVSIYLTVWDTWGKTCAHTTWTCVSSLKLKLKTIDTTPTYCDMLMISLLFITMIWSLSTILISILIEDWLNWWSQHVFWS